MKNELSSRKETKIRNMIRKFLSTVSNFITTKYIGLSNACHISQMWVDPMKMRENRTKGLSTNQLDLGIPTTITLFNFGSIPKPSICDRIPQNRDCWFGMHEKPAKQLNTSLPDSNSNTWIYCRQNSQRTQEESPTIRSNKPKPWEPYQSTLIFRSLKRKKLNRLVNQ